MPDDTMAANAVESTGEIANSNTDATTESTSEVQASTEGVVTEPQQDITQTQAFSHRLKEESSKAEQRARDSVIAEMYGESHGIKTYSDYQSAIEAERVRVEAEQKGYDPELYARLSSAEQKLSSYERERTQSEQEQSLAPKPFFNDWKDEVKDLAKRANCDYATAYTLLAEQKMPDIIANHEAKIKEAKDNAVKEYLAAKTRPQGTVEGTGQTPVTTATAPKSFADAKRQSMELLNLQFRKE